MSVVFDKLHHNFDHIFFIIVLVEIVESLQFDESFEVIVSLFEVDDLYEIVLGEDRFVFEGHQIQIFVDYFCL